MTCKSVEQEENHEKPPMLVVGQKPNGEFQVKVNQTLFRMMTRKTFFSVLATLQFAFCAMATTPRVLILGDGGSEVFAKQALSDAGADVTVVNNYADWDGVTPSAAGFDVFDERQLQLRGHLERDSTEPSNRDGSSCVVV